MKMFFRISLGNSKRIGFLAKRDIVNYVQGQEPEPNVREYFYFIDHQGMLFLDDSKMKNFTSCFKERKFLRFFFNQLRPNNTNRYNQEFPFVSKCGKERNFVRCDDFPIVFTQIIDKNEGSDDVHLMYNNCDLSLKFHPEKVAMDPSTGRVYHPAPERVGSIGLIQSKLAIELSKSFIFENGEAKPPTKLIFRDEIYELDNWLKSRIVDFKT